MNLKNILSLKGINGWHLANTLGWNFLGSGAVLLTTLYLLNKNHTAVVFYQFFLLIGIFLVPLTGGLLFGRLAADNRGITYGVLGSFVSVAQVLIFVLPSSVILGSMLIIIALAGGFNGGILSYKKSKQNNSTGGDYEHQKRNHPWG
jgi:hypothetical protein